MILSERETSVTEEQLNVQTRDTKNNVLDDEKLRSIVKDMIFLDPTVKRFIIHIGLHTNIHIPEEYIQDGRAAIRTDEKDSQEFGENTGASKKYFAHVLYSIRGSDRLTLYKSPKTS